MNSGITTATGRPPRVTPSRGVTPEWKKTGQNDGGRWDRVVELWRDDSWEKGHHFVAIKKWSPVFRGNRRHPQLPPRVVPTLVTPLQINPTEYVMCVCVVQYSLFVICLVVFAVITSITVLFLHLRAESKPVPVIPRCVSTGWAKKLSPPVFAPISYSNSKIYITCVMHFEM